MEINADFSKRATVVTGDLPWIASPMPGVDRRMLDRIGEEVARATSIVRYAPGSTFSAHTHDGGEEFIVLAGTFQDEHGDYPVGTYVRNPPTSQHTPGSESGCTIFVKLWQFDPDDRSHVRKAMADELGPPKDGVATAMLFSDARETVTYRRLAAGASVLLDDPGGYEALVISGSVIEQGTEHPTGTWLRCPENTPLTLIGGAAGADLWVKTGHLPFAQAPTD